MKNAFLSIAGCFLMIGCASLSSQDAVKDFIPGTYVRPINDTIYDKTYVIGMDTLHIKKQTESGSETYQVDQGSRFQRTMDGNPQPEEYKVKTWTGSYQDADKTLLIKSTGKTIAFDIKNRLIKLDEKEYKKIE